MNKEEFISIVNKENINLDSFSLYQNNDESLVLERDGYEWIVFYSERGIQSGKKVFHSESDALDYMLKTLLKSEVSRQKPRGY